MFITKRKNSLRRDVCFHACTLLISESHTWKATFLLKWIFTVCSFHTCTSPKSQVNIPNFSTILKLFWSISFKFKLDIHFLNKFQFQFLFLILRTTKIKMKNTKTQTNLVLLLWTKKSKYHFFSKFYFSPMICQCTHG